VSELFRELLNFHDKGVAAQNICGKIQAEVASPSLWHKIRRNFFGPLNLFILGLKLSTGRKVNIMNFFSSKNYRQNIAITPIIPLDKIKKIRMATSTSFSSAVITLMGKSYGKLRTSAGLPVPEQIICATSRSAVGHPTTKLRNHL